MLDLPDVVWVNANPSFRPFDQPLLNLLSKKTALAEWQYSQSADEPASPEIALMLLREHLVQYKRPVHLLGHAMGGFVSLLYARQYPEDVQSLTLLSVGPDSVIDWQAHYFVQFNSLPCSRKNILTQIVYGLFGSQSYSLVEKYRQILEEDLLTSVSPHSLYQRLHLSPVKVSPPMLVCLGEHDFVIDSKLSPGWQPWLKEGDLLWQCLKGRYFFHYFYPEQVSGQIIDFWQAESVVNMVRKPV